MKDWDTLQCEDGVGIVVPEGTEPMAALLAMLEAGHGSGQDKYDLTHPALVEAASEVRISLWRSCTKPWREDRGVDDWDSYWAEDGDGKRTLRVAYYDGSIYDLGDQITKEDTP